ncbi:Ribosomal protein L21 [Candidatus Magnetoovum chiemensis]|nr:Ribosomal protein L21 [Candidatus Magnetoovum chiemensis]
MFAIIETGSKQYRVSNEHTVKVEKLNTKEGETVIIDKVLVISNESGLKIGTPYIEGAKVSATVLSTSKDKKRYIFKIKPRKGHRKLKGHRQTYSLLKIEEIIGG